MLQRLLIFSFLFFSVIFAEEEFSPDEPFSSSLVKTQNLLSTTVNSVSTISGEWLNSEIDFIVIAPEPLILTRAYSGAYAYSKKLGYNWDFNRPHSLMIEENGMHHKSYKARYNQPMGIVSIHESKNVTEREAEKGSVRLLLHKTLGLTNCRSGEISARTNLHNTLIEFDKSKAHCAAITGAGHITYFKYNYKTEGRAIQKKGEFLFDDSVHYHYKPDFEKKANGNYVIYQKEGIYSVNPSQDIKYGWITFHPLGPEAFEVTASDGKKVRYEFSCYTHGNNIEHDSQKEKKEANKKYALKQVIYSHKPTENYEYTHLAPRDATKHPKNPLLKCKRLPEGRFQAVNYYHSGNNHVDGLDNFSIDEEDFRYHRVKEIKGPVGSDQTPIVTHRFIYHADGVAKRNHPYSGKTEVYDAYLNKTVYVYNADHRPTSVRRFNKNQQLYSAENYVWDDLYTYPTEFPKQQYKTLLLSKQTSKNHTKDAHEKIKGKRRKDKRDKEKNKKRVKEYNKRRRRKIEDKKIENEEKKEKQKKIFEELEKQEELQKEKIDEKLKEEEEKKQKFRKGAKKYKEEQEKKDEEEEDEEKKHPLPLTRGITQPPPYIEDKLPDAPEPPNTNDIPLIDGHAAHIATKDNIKKIIEERKEKKQEEKEREEQEDNNSKRKRIPPLPAKIRKLLGEAEDFLFSSDITAEELIKRCSKAKILQKGGNGNLRSKYFQNATGEILYAQNFYYDKKGNIVREKFAGNLTGRSTSQISLNLHGEPKGGEFYKKEYAYSDDSLNLLLAEHEDNGRGVIYHYYPETDLLSAKFITDFDQICFRQFYHYDGNGTLIKTSKDNGVKEDENDLIGITERLITYFTPTSTPPYGLPEIIEEKYWDSQQEVSLKRTTCRYSEDGHLIHQDHYDSLGNYRYSLSWEYDSHGNVISETNAIGQVVRKKYDLNDNLIFEEEVGLNKRYTYDFSNRLISTEEIHPDGKVFVVSHRYDYNGNKIATRDRFGQETLYHYDEFNRLIRTEFPSVMMNDNLIIPTTETIYDEANHPSVMIDACGHHTVLTYNSRESPISVQHPDETIEKMAYNLDGTLANTIASNGTKTHYERDFLGRVVAEENYDSKGELLTLQTYTYQGNHLATKTDPEGCITKYTYDGAGRLVREIRGNSCTTQEYDPLGRISKVIKKTGFENSIQTFRYDLLNRLIEERCEDDQGNILQYKAYTYDEQGNIIRSQKGESITLTTYNADRKPVKIVDPEGQTTYISYNYTCRNAQGQNVLEIITIDEQGRHLHQIHNALGHICEVLHKDSFGSVIAKKAINYDPMGRPLQTIDTVLAEGNFQRHYINAWHYHPNGQEDLIIEGVGPDQKMTQFFYNAFGQKEREVKPNGVEIAYTYDALGRLHQMSSNEGSIAYQYSYNRCDQVLEVKDLKNKTATTRRYNEEGFVIQENLANGLSIGYTFDLIGRPTALYLPDGSSVQYCYNAAYLKEVQRCKNGICYQHTYDKYSLAGDILQSTLIGHVGKSEYLFDKARRVKHITHPSWVQEIQYDHLGRLISKKDKLNSLEYSYDALDHLQTEQGRLSYRYQTDSIHNRLRKNESIYDINTHNQVLSQGKCQYRYDWNGNTIEKIQNGEKTKYTYDALNRLISVQTSEEKTTYQYDAFGRRMSKTKQGKTIRYLYQGQNEIGAVDEQDQIQELRVLGTGIAAEIGSAISLELYGKIYVPLHDSQGHLIRLLDTDGNIVESYLYSAFGEEIILDSNRQEIKESLVGNSWHFACKRRDSETQWIYFGHRYYDSEIGRWTTHDPLFFADGPNLYAYLLHNPLAGYDAYGLIGEAMDEATSVAIYVAGQSSEFAPVFRESNSSDKNNVVDTIVDGGEAFVNGFSHGMQHPWDSAFKNSGVGMFVKFATDTDQVDFTGNDPPQTIIMNVCDKVGELGGSWFVLSSTSSLGKMAGSAVYSLGKEACNWFFGREAEQLTVANVVANESTAVITAETATAGQAIRTELELAKEGVCIKSPSIDKLKVQEAERLVNEYLGEGVKLKKNKAGDLVFLSKGGTRKFRYDFIEPDPHKNPHVHVEWKTGKNWDTVRIYPTDVPHY